jgi:hypothetical protein
MVRKEREIIGASSKGGSAKSMGRRGAAARSHRGDPQCLPAAEARFLRRLLRMRKRACDFERPKIQERPGITAGRVVLDDDSCMEVTTLKDHAETASASPLWWHPLRPRGNDPNLG